MNERTRHLKEAFIRCVMPKTREQLLNAIFHSELPTYKPHVPGPDYQTIVEQAVAALTRQERWGFFKQRMADRFHPPVIWRPGQKLGRYAPLRQYPRHWARGLRWSRLVCRVFGCPRYGTWTGNCR